MTADSNTTARAQPSVPRRFSTLRAAAAIISFGLIVSACGGASSGDGHGAGHEDMDTAPVDALGEAGEASEADREVNVETLDELTFEPALIEVEAGETVTFVVENTGRLPHEFVLGGEAYQDAHESEMSGEAGDMHHSVNSVEVDPGETAELTWTFAESGETLFGCHVPGHYDGGMVGALEVRT
ncbi:MAG: multicopper oxidase domain-containing protein [Actinobacteria bacterium]|nr:multicopper oxidase domain-containing protein [Actinomycetota bacterium]